MPNAQYRIVPIAEGWAVEHDGEKSAGYATKEAAFEATIGPASNAIKEGLGVTIQVPGRRRREEPALGAS